MYRNIDSECYHLILEKQIYPFVGPQDGVRNQNWPSKDLEWIVLLSLFMYNTYMRGRWPRRASPQSVSELKPSVQKGHPHTEHIVRSTDGQGPYATYMDLSDGGCVGLRRETGRQFLGENVNEFGDDEVGEDGHGRGFANQEGMLTQGGLKPTAPWHGLRFSHSNPGVLHSNINTS